jgi:hypothetical protein
MMLTLAVDPGHLRATRRRQSSGQRQLAYFYGPARFELWIAARSTLVVGKASLCMNRM